MYKYVSCCCWTKTKLISAAVTKNRLFVQRNLCSGIWVNSCLAINPCRSFPTSETVNTHTNGIVLTCRTETTQTNEFELVIHAQSQGIAHNCNTKGVSITSTIYSQLDCQDPKHGVCRIAVPSFVFEKYFPKVIWGKKPMQLKTFDLRPEQELIWWMFRKSTLEAGSVWALYLWPKLFPFTRCSFKCIQNTPELSNETANDVALMKHSRLTSCVVHFTRAWSGQLWDNQVHAGAA